MKGILNMTPSGWKTVHCGDRVDRMYFSPARRDSTMCQTKWCGLMVLFALASAVMAVPITLPMQKRDRNNKPSVERVEVQARELGIIVMDMWDSHWDRTYQERSGALVPKLNQFLHDARAAGAIVIYSPTAMIENGRRVYGEAKQRQSVKDLPDVPIPPNNLFQSPEPQMWLYDGIHMNGAPVTGTRHVAGPHFPLTNQDAGLDVEPDDYFIGDGNRSVQELYNVIEKHKLKRLLYTGGALNMCLYGKPIGVLYLRQRDFPLAIVRELTEGWSTPRHWYKIDEPFPKELGEFSHAKADAMMVEWYERNVCPSVPMDLFPATPKLRDVKLQNATAQFSQPWGFYAALAIDRSPAAKNGWGNGGNPAKRNALVVQTAPLAGNDCTDKLVFVLDFLSTDRAGIGKFRLSITDDRRDTYADGLSNGGRIDAKWTVLKPMAARTMNRFSHVEIQSDGTLLVKVGEQPANCDRYIVNVVNPLGAKATGFRLDALPDPSLPAGGPGLAEDGSFLLQEFMVRSVGERK